MRSVGWHPYPSATTYLPTLPVSPKAPAPITLASSGGAELIDLLRAFVRSSSVYNADNTCQATTTQIHP